MTETPEDMPRVVAARRRSAAGRALIVVAIVLALILAMLAALYLNRRAAAREILIGWLDQRGIQADLEVERLEVDGFVGKIRIGDADDPDVTIERVEVDYAIGLPWSKAGLGVTPSRIRLVRPILRASWKDGALSLGSLDPLVDEFAARPPRPDSRAPLVLVEQGRLRMDTEYGPFQILGDARVDDGKLIRLAAHMPAASLKSGEVEARGLGGRLNLTTTGDRVSVAAALQAEYVTHGETRGETVAFDLTGDLPYPDLKARRGDGRAVLSARVTAATAASGRTAARGLDAALAFDGRTAGWIEDFQLVGTGRAEARSDRLEAAGSTMSGLVAELDQADLDIGRQARGVAWRLNSALRLAARAATAGDARLNDAVIQSSRLVAGGRGGTFEAQGPLAVRAARLASGELVLNGATGKAELDVVRDGATLITVSGSLSAPRAAWPLFGAPGPDDAPELAELKRALGAFALDVPAWRLTTGSPGTEAVLSRPARIRPANGGELIVSAGAGPAYSAEPGERGGGALQIEARRGGGLPEAVFSIPRWTLTDGGFRARLDGRAMLDFTPARGVRLETKGELVSNRGRLTYVAAGCVPLTVERLDLGENQVSAVSGGFCPQDQPLIVVSDGRWRAQGRFEAGAATADFLAMRFTGLSGRVTVDGGPSGLAMDATVSAGRVSDVTNTARFNPLNASGTAALRDERWTGSFDLRSGEWPIGRVELVHDGRAEAGGLSIATPDLVFTAAGLQPDDLSALAADYLKSPVEGSARFEGRFDWAAAGATSSGVLTTPGLDFESPIGKAEGLKGQVRFTSLTPLITAPDQRLTIDRLQTVTPVTDLDVTFALDADALRLGGGKIEIAGGQVRIEPFSIPLQPDQPWDGVVVLERLQLGELLKSANLQDKAELDAVVSGRLPFTMTPGAGFRVVGGVLHAVRPGRLSINPEVFDDLEAGGAGVEEAVPPNTMQDLAYQALQDLAISDLTADVNSLDGGRLGVRFRINGRHDPPERQELRLGLMELIRQDFLKRKLPLPSDTPIDLTLDTTWNANEILADLLEMARSTGAPNDVDATNAAPK